MTTGLQENSEKILMSQDPIIRASIEAFVDTLHLPQHKLTKAEIACLSAFLLLKYDKAGNVDKVFDIIETVGDMTAMWKSSPSPEARALADGLGYFIGGLILQELKSIPPKEQPTVMPIRVQTTGQPSKEEIKTAILQFMAKISEEKN